MDGTVAAKLSGGSTQELATRFGHVDSEAHCNGVLSHNFHLATGQVCSPSNLHCGLTDPPAKWPKPRFCRCCLVLSGRMTLVRLLTACAAAGTLAALSAQAS